MTIFKFKKRIDIDKHIGNLRLETFYYGSYENGVHKNWTELCLWYDEKCDECVCGWEDRSYEGECNACGCCVSKDGDFSAPTVICMLPNWIKNILIKCKFTF